MNEQQKKGNDSETDAKSKSQKSKVKKKDKYFLKLGTEHRKMSHQLLSESKSLQSCFAIEYLP